MTASRSKRLLRTTDLSLATWLIMCGHTPDLIEDGEVRPGHPRGAWEFTETPMLTANWHTFEEGQAQVEPGEFQERVFKTRRELFEFLGIGDK